MTALCLLLGAAGVSFGLTLLLRRYALARRIFDVPNERSSHSASTPRGGGLAIAVTFLGCLVALWMMRVVSLPTFAALGGAGALMALIGFLDDRYTVSRRWRVAAQLAGAIWALYWLNGMPALTDIGFELQPGWLSSTIAVLYVLWVANLYNFMDGIDGIASIEAITVCLGGVLLYLVVAPGSTQWMVPAAMIASVAGFLYWNYPPARIFMGDAGSGFLGMSLALLSIQAAWVVPSLIWAWIIMLAAFVVDASVTLIRRMLSGGGRYLQAHRSHAYQYAARRFGAHKPVSLTVGAINLAWLCPLAMAVGLGHLGALPGLLLAYAPLVALAFWFKAGVYDR